MAHLIEGCLGQSQASIAEQVSHLTSEELIQLHNRLEEIDDQLKNRWVELGCPHPELLR